MIKHISEGKTSSELSEIYNCNGKTITNYKSRYGLTRNKVNIKELELITLVDLGFTNKQLCEHFKCSNSPIKKYKKMFGIVSPEAPDCIYSET